MRFVLASASPARLATLRRAGLEPEVIVSGVDESGVHADSVAQLVTELARLKAVSVAAQLAATTSDPEDGAGSDSDHGPDGRHADGTEAGEEAIVLGCDSLLEFEGRAFGKPDDTQTAVARWRAIRGRSAILHTGHALLVPGRPADVRVASTRVHFGAVSDTEIDAYVSTGEPLQVAGGFTIDGLGGWFIDSIEGDHHNVVGLSLPLLRRMLADAGIGIGELLT